MTNFEIESALKKTELYKGLFLNIFHSEERVSKSNLKLECEQKYNLKLTARQSIP